jgi:L-seryl-tRNA(Ser) seleniumtransferase
MEHDAMTPNFLKKLPSVNELLEHAPLKGLADRVSRNVVVSRVRSFLDNLRVDVKEAAAEINLPTPSELAERIAQWIATEPGPSLQPVINATGAILHPSLGPPPLARRAVEQMAAFADAYASTDFDLSTGRHLLDLKTVERRLVELTGAEAAVVVGSSASAMIGVLAALTADREVVVSRGQLIEIDGRVRLTELIEAVGASLCEVGTANATRIDDYADAVSDATGALLRVHGSQFVALGAVEQASVEELAALAKKKSVPLIDNLGSGGLIDVSQFGLTDEPVAAASVKAGADVVVISGDKLLGGPQCGIVVGRRQYIDKIVAHPMVQAMRADKATLGALAATLRLYRDEEIARRDVPVLSLLATSMENLRNRAERLAPQIAACKSIAEADAVVETAYLHGESVPTQEIPTWCISVRPADDDLDSLAQALRLGRPPVVGRVKEGRLLFDQRSVLPRQDIELVDAVSALDAEADA